MSKPNFARVRCLCGQVVGVKLGGKRRCKCGVMLRANRNYLGMVTPWAWITEDTLTQRKRAGKPVKHKRPKIVGWLWAGAR